MPIAGGEAERLTSDTADDFAPDLSPDGKEVAFHSWRTGSRDIYVQPLDGRPLQHVTSTPAQELIPSWSPDGLTIAYMVGNTERSIWLVHRGDASGRWQAPVEREAVGGWAAWSPDGKSIAYVTRLHGGSLMVAPSDSGAARLLLDGDVASSLRAERPVWSADGLVLYFKSHDASGSASIWSIPSAGGTPTLLVRFADPAHPSYRSQWAYGANRFFFPVQDRQSDVWVIDAVHP